MSSPHDGGSQPGDPAGSGKSPAGGDILELGSSRPPVRWRLPSVRWRRPPTVALILGAAGLIIGLATGYAAGARQAHGAAPLSQPGSATAQTVEGGFPLSQTGPWCSTQTGGELQLGVQVTNVSATALVLGQIGVTLPIGGLTPVAQGWGTCGELPAASVEPNTAVPAGASAWFTVTFRVLVRCPAPLPVRFTLRYQLDGQPYTAKLPGFVDLGQVPYTGCS